MSTVLLGYGWVVLEHAAELNSCWTSPVYLLGTDRYGRIDFSKVVIFVYADYELKTSPASK